ncbi:DUF3426 domain-containing protein [Pseudomonas sp. 21LCFQ02]|uniref:DUF3426 domain-containing protein n=1 Tax=Pseudomonas sp. 21LCFQ02 TaxID=2957505 RepID=UPI00209A8236|nr:DUF3426 domain-containing protein [Pseudomonas sp. 21LCFQ02]MCO8170975.1 DUF3426 domain-containing protein [Pseudomonas sp. 21LCFQ02]
MTDSFVTQCPHCQTSFKVNHAQLSVARGVVRCGSCLQVFNAAKQLLEQSHQQRTALAPLPAPAEPAALPEPEAVTEPAPQAPLEPAPLAAEPPAAVPVVAEPVPPAINAAPGEDYWHVSELDLDSLDLDEELARLEQREIQLAESVATVDARAPQANLSARRDAAPGEAGEWIASLANDDVEQLPEVHAEVIRAREPEPEPDEPDHPIVEPAAAHETRTEPSLSLNSIADEDKGPDFTALELRKQPPGHSARLSALDDEDEPAPDDDDHDHDPRGRSEPALRDKPLVDLTDDPLQLDWQRPKPRWGRRLLWITLITLALSGLAGQYIWYHFDHLARQDQYRPWFQQLCPQLGCKVPSKVDINQLKSSNLVVRSHPEFQGALVVDAIIYNRASFSQPFPLLELRFADTSGQLIASRRFKPGEYLSGEMAGKEEMPPQTPIHIALDILDPGAKAVNYSLNFRSPE